MKRRYPKCGLEVREKIPETESHKAAVGRADSVWSSRLESFSQILEFQPSQ